MKKNAKAFSLIETSIVILIVSLIFGMIVKSYSSSYEARLRTAIGLTRGAPVRNVEGLVAWFEPTLPESFDETQASNEQRVTTWYDINPQKLTKNNATQSTSFSPYYSEKAANGLPALDCRTTSLSFRTSNSGFPKITELRKKFTFFVVSKSTSTAASIRSVVRYGSGTGDGGWGYKKSSGNLRFIEFYSSGVASGTNITGGTISSDWEIAAGVFDGTNISLYINGVADTLTTSTASLVSPNNDVSFLVNICGSEGWLGYVAEVILFGDAISADDRKDIEKYLGQKYKITVSP